MRLRAAGKRTGHRIAVVDDDITLVESICKLLERDGHDVRSATNRRDGVELVRSFEPHLLLLDYHLGADTGVSVVEDIREFDPLCQVLLVTGYAAEQPARTLLAKLDIQGFHDKGDGPERLLVLVDAALKHARALRTLDRRRRHLRLLLDAGTTIARLQPVPELLASSLEALGALLAGGDGMIATANSGLFVLGSPSSTVSVQAGSGRFAEVRGLHDLPPATSDAVRAALSADVPTVRAGWVMVPLRTRDGDRGCMIVEADALPDDVIEPCELLARQVTQALENVLLYERATVDTLTTLFTRDFGLRRLEEAVRLGGRTGAPTSAVLVDVDHFKRVNDTYGHAAGDLVLRAVSGAVRASCRSTDVAARYGGEELLVVLPATDERGACVIAERIRARIAAEQVHVDGVAIRVTASLGVATVGPTAAGELPVTLLVEAADRGLYAAKRAGRDRTAVGLVDLGAGARAA